MSNLMQDTINAIHDAGKKLEDISYFCITRLNYDDYEFETLYKGKSFDAEQLDLEYDNGYGTQEIGGFIVFTDNSWLSRNEYDGSEWWEYNKCPELEE